MNNPPPSPTQPPPIYAGFWLRFAAALIDSLVLFFPFCVAALIGVVFVRLLSAARGYDPAVGIIIVCSTMSIIVSWLYFALTESSSWQATVGKKALGLYVTDIDGRRLTLSRATVRTFAKFLSTITVGIGYILCAFTKKKQALHDIVSNCLVLRRPRPER
jgi:uncharacterized RDD family membrane protein YckC